MAPLSFVNDPSLEEQFHAPATHLDVQNATQSISSTPRVIILLLAALTLATGALYLLVRRRHRTTQWVLPTTPRFVYESNVSIDFEDAEDEEGTIVDVDLPDGRSSLETILSDGTPRRFTFDADQIMPFLGRRKGSILDRRGRSTMLCDTTAYYTSDIVPTMTKSPIDRKICRPQVNFLENVASPLTPFWAKQVNNGLGSARRPVFGFSAKTITPPLGSAMWNVKGDARAAVAQSTSRTGCWTP